MTAEEYMKIALNLAQKAAKTDEVPVGAIIVNPENGEILAQAYNQSAHSGDATAHAEILAIQQACAKLKTTRLWGLDLYVTLEPCTMCAAAISFARIAHLYFGATDEKGGAVISGVRFYEAPTCHHRPQYTGGICAEECSQILKDFFAHKRV
ncbi:MAG: nucleoside deaminase [Alphaproteobacteria bacterium]|nr:nucleoside deaminase [Alphaproteobacteria bacterium]